MRFPFFSRVPTRQVMLASGSDAARQAGQVLEALLAGLPELQLGYVFDLKGNALLASYTTSPAYNPHHLTVRYANVLRTVQQALATKAWPGGDCTDLTLLLDEQVQHLRPLPDRGWYCLVAGRLADANLGLVKEVMRRATAAHQPAN